MQCQSSTHGTCTHAPTITYGAVLAGTGDLASEIHVRHEVDVDKVVRAGVVVGVGLRVVHVHLLRVAMEGYLCTSDLPQTVHI